MIYTSDYFTVWGQPNAVKISNGMPKGFQAEFAIPELYPKWVWVRYHIPWEKFIPLYNNEILAKLDADLIAKKCEGKILCCYEKLDKAHCHRELVRDWFIANDYNCEEWK